MKDNSLGKIRKKPRNVELEFHKGSVVKFKNAFLN